MTALYIIIAILFFGLLVGIHELGHFLTAKACGIRVEEFSIGLGPAIFKKQKGETTYSLRAVPFGGYCAMTGENEESDDPRAFSSQKLWKKLIVLFAGSFMNFLLGIILIFILVEAWNDAPLWPVLRHSFEICIEFVKLVWQGIAMLFNGQAGISDLSGPVGIVDVMVQTAEQAETTTYAISDLTYLGAFIAVNLAVMNLLPIPALDGGRIFLLLVTAVIEAVTGKKLNKKYEAYIHGAGMILLLLLMAYVMFHDVWRLIFGIQP